MAALETDDDNSVELISTQESKDTTDGNEMPIMALFKRLIGNDSKQNTVLTNTQIIDILHKEFDMKISEMHDLKVDIYLNVMKKFLKDWPQWDEFDQVINNLRETDDNDGINKTLDAKYKSLKTYLKDMLDIAEEKANEAVKSVETNIARKNNQLNKDQSVYLEIHCSRAQLNKLFFRQPIPELNNTIFNVDEGEPTKITLNTPTLEALLNSFAVSAYIIFPHFSYKREMIHECNHILVNKKLNLIREFKNLDTCFEEKSALKAKVTNKSTLFKTLNSIKSVFHLSKYENLINLFYNIILRDFYEMPDKVKVPASYRKYLNKHPYVRYLYSDVEQCGIKGDTKPLTSQSNQAELSKFELQLEETLLPKYMLNLQKCKEPYGIAAMERDLLFDKNWKIQVSCTTCSVKFEDLDIIDNMPQHFLVHHCDNIDWQCTKCQNTFSTNHLAHNRWFHNCTPQSKDCPN